MIRITLQGRLGNQMFQYATAFALAKRHATHVSVDRSKFMGRRSRHQFELWRFAKLELPAIGLPAAVLFRLRRAAGLVSPPVPTFRMPVLGYNEAVRHLPEDAALDGWFQSERYFRDAASDIRELYDLRPFKAAGMDQALDRLRDRGDVVSLHVRRGDYVGFSLFDVDIETYYRAAMDCAEARRKCVFLVVSDDLAWCRAQSLFRRPDVVFSDELGLEYRASLDEMALMAHCDHNIISNSTFAWWAAWLNLSSQKLVAMPRQWLSSMTAGECGLDVDRWVQI